MFQGIYSMKANGAVTQSSSTMLHDSAKCFAVVHITICTYLLEITMWAFTQCKLYIDFLNIAMLRYHL